VYAATFRRLSELSAWLEKTHLSQLIQSHEWVIPAVQSMHILAISMLAASALMINLRLLGLYAADQPLNEVLARFLPFIWWPLLVLLLTGMVMIIGEPPRSLKNPAFQLKMLLLLAALLVTAICQIAPRLQPAFGEISTGRTVGAVILASTSIALWVGIIFAGRWIAYYY
jgi:hypothetical protein